MRRRVTVVVSCVCVCVCLSVRYRSSYFNVRLYLQPTTPTDSYAHAQLARAERFQYILEDYYACFRDLVSEKLSSLPPTVFCHVFHCSIYAPRVCTLVLHVVELHSVICQPLTCKSRVLEARIAHTPNIAHQTYQEMLIKLLSTEHRVGVYCEKRLYKHFRERERERASDLGIWALL